MIPYTAQEYRTAKDTAYALLQPPPAGPAPLLLLFASTAVNTLSTLPYGRTGHRLAAQGWTVVSLDLPCHGAERQPGEPAELDGWAARIGRRNDFVAAFQTRVNDVVDHLVATRAVDPARIAAAGTSRGGFLAFHAAAGNPRIRAVAAFAPVTDLRALREFAGSGDNPLVQRLALEQTVEALADRAAWITIGNADARVDTDRVIAFTRALCGAAARRGLAPQIELHVLPVPGHSSLDEWHDAAAGWLTRGGKRD